MLPLWLMLFSIYSGFFFPRLHALMNYQRHFVNSQNRIKCNWILSEWDLRFIIVIIESAKIQSLHVRHLRDFVHATQSHVFQCPHHILPHTHTASNYGKQQLIIMHSNLNGCDPNTLITGNLICVHLWSIFDYYPLI